VWRCRFDIKEVRVGIKLPVAHLYIRPLSQHGTLAVPIWFCWDLAERKTFRDPFRETDADNWRNPDGTFEPPKAIISISTWSFNCFAAQRGPAFGLADGCAGR